MELIKIIYRFCIAAVLGMGFSHLANPSCQAGKNAWAVNIKVPAGSSPIVFDECQFIAQLISLYSF